MKSKNFPERRRQRQKRALFRLYLHRDTMNSHGTGYDRRVDEEIATLEQRTAQPLRSVRTKKRRGEDTRRRKDAN